MLDVGRVFEDRYYIDREIGRGSFGVVYLAHDIATGEPRAIKVLLPWTRRDQSLRHRLKREAKLAGLLKSRHSIRVDSLGETRSGDLYLVMEYLEGRDLAELFERGKMPPARVVMIALAVLEALAEAHALGVIHRDLKPSNIIVCQGPDGAEVVKVLDFGIAKMSSAKVGELHETTKLTVAGGILGTPVYMSPEQCRGEELTPASDLYSLGVVMYEALSGRVPFDDANPVRVMMLHNQTVAPPLPAEVAASHLGRAVMKSLAKSPATRFASAEEFASALTGSRPITASALASAAAVPAFEDDAASPARAQAEAKPNSATARRGTSILAKPAYWAAACVALVAILAALLAMQWL